MAKISVQKQIILAKDRVGDGVSLQKAVFNSETLLFPESKYRIVVKDGLFPGVSFSNALRQIMDSGVKKNEISAVDFRGKLKGALKQYAKNFAENVLGEGIQVRDRVSKNDTVRALKRDAKNAHSLVKKTIKESPRSDLD